MGEQNRPSTRRNLPDESGIWSTVESSHRAQNLEGTRGSGFLRSHPSRDPRSEGTTVGALNGPCGLKGEGSGVWGGGAVLSGQMLVVRSPGRGKGACLLWMSVMPSLISWNIPNIIIFKYFFLFCNIDFTCIGFISDYFVRSFFL